MGETKDVTGVIELIQDKEPKSFNKNGKTNYIYKTSVLLEDKTWHNISSFDSQEDCNKVLNKLDGGKFVKGDSVLITEEKSGDFWNVKAITEADKIATEVVQTNDEIAKEQGTPIGSVDKTPWNKDSDILLAVAFKGAVEIVDSATRKIEAVDMAESAKHALFFTPQIFKGLKKAKLELQESGDW